LIVYTPKMPGRHRISATALVKREGAYTLTVREEGGTQVAEGGPKPPAGTAPGQSLLQGRTQQDGLTVNTLLLPGNQAAADLTGTSAGDAFFVLTQEGWLSRVALKDFVVQKQVKAGGNGSFLALSAEGLVATVTNPHELCVVDPDTLQVRRRIPV